MPIPNNESSSEKDIFFTDKFKTLVRSEKELLLRSASLTPALELNQVHAYRNDFYRLMRTQGVPSYLRWATAFINGITDPNQDISGMTSFYLISEPTLSAALARSSTVQG